MWSWLFVFFFTENTRRSPGTSDTLGSSLSLFISTLNVRWDKLSSFLFLTIFFFFFFNPDWTQKLCLLLLVLRKSLRFGRMCWLKYLLLLYFPKNGVQQIPSENPSNHLLCKLMSPWTRFCVDVTTIFLPFVLFLCQNLMKTVLRRSEMFQRKQQRRRSFIPTACG